MRGRWKLLAALVLLALPAAPELLLAAAHALEGHTHTGHAPSGAARAALAEALVHGHGHPEGTAPHEHDLAPAPPLRQDPPRRLADAPSRPLSLQQAARLAPVAAHCERAPAALTGCGPPPLQLLCVLLI